MTDRETMQMALDALEWNTAHSDDDNAKKHEAIEALRQALAQPEIPMSPEHLPQYIATNNIKPTTEGGGGAGGTQPEQEPVAYIDHVSGKPKFIDGYVVQTDYDIPLYTTPPKREWVGLTDDEVKDILDCRRGGLVDISKAQQLLKDKNT